MKEKDAIKLQEELSKQVILKDMLPAKVETVAGLDVAYEKGGDRIVSAVVILDSETLKPIEVTTWAGKADFPYIPGLFSFRELPPILKAFSKLTKIPDLIVCDGHGIAHPRRFGLACHVGVVTGIPSIGCAKNRLVGTYELPGALRGSCSDLIENDEVIGKVLRTQDYKKPVFVSAGHKISNETACEWILKLSAFYRLPETTRAADQAVRRELKTRDQNI